MGHEPHWGQAGPKLAVRVDGVLGGGGKEGACEAGSSCRTLLDSGLPRRDTAWCREMLVPSLAVDPGEAWLGLGQSLPEKVKVLLC